MTLLFAPPAKAARSAIWLSRSEPMPQGEYHISNSTEKQQLFCS